jgi:hypothetical protein
MQVLLSVSRSQPAGGKAYEAGGRTQNVPNRRQHTGVIPGGIEHFIAEQVAHNERAGMILRRLVKERLQPGAHLCNALRIDNAFEGEIAVLV